MGLDPGSPQQHGARWPSLVAGQAEEVGLEVLQGTQNQGGLTCQVLAQVFMGNRHHLHPGRQGRLHPIGSVFKDQALLQGWPGENLPAQARKMSGLGLQLFTSGSSPSTMWSDKLKKEGLVSSGLHLKGRGPHPGGQGEGNAVLPQVA